MACELDKAILVLNEKPAIKRAINAIVNQNEIVEKEFGKLVVEVTGTKAPNITKFANKLGGYIRNATGVTVEKDPMFVLNQVASMSSEVILGNYSRIDNKITIGKYDTKKDVQVTLENAVYEDLLQAYDKDTADSIVNSSDYKVNVKSKVADIFNSIKMARGTNLLLHELTHVGAVEYMTLNPEAPATKRIEQLYNHLYQNHDKYGIKADRWKYSIDEFIAEAMSNKELIASLMAIKPEKPIKRLSNVYEIVLNTLTSMLGLPTNRTETLFDVLLDANVAILQEQGYLSTSPESQKPTKKAPKESKGTTSPVEVTEATVEAEEVSTVYINKIIADAKVADPKFDEKDYIKNYLKLSVPALKLHELIGANSKSIGLNRATTEVKKAVQDKQAEIATALNDITELEKYAPVANTVGILSINNVPDKSIADTKGTYTLGTLLSTGTPTSEFASVVFNNKDLNTMYTEEALTSLLDNSGLNGTLDKNGNKKPYGRGTMVNHPHLMLMSTADGKLHNNVLMAMKMSIVEYIAENFEALVKLSPKDIQSIYGRTEENWMELRQDVLDGGVPATFIVDKVSKDLAKKLGIKALVTKDNNYSEYYEKVMSGLAYEITQHIADTGILEQVRVGMDNSDVRTVTYKLSEVNRNQPTKMAFINNAKKWKELYTIGKDDNVKVHTTPLKRSPDNMKTHKEPLVIVPENSAKAIVKSEQTRWDPHTDAVDFILNIKEANLRKLLGAKDETAKDLTKEQEISIIGKNRQIDSDIENVYAMQDAIESGDADDGVYFRWFASKSGRQMIDAKGGFNPQSIKLHRYLVTTKEQRGTVDAAKDPMSMTMFKLGIAQAFGFKTDKTDINLSEEFADKVLTKGSLRLIRNGINNGEAEITISKDTVVKIKELSHSVTALMEGQKYIDADKGTKPFETSMTTEVDGLTNGFGHKMVQYLASDKLGEEITDNTVKWLNKIGFTFKSKEEANDMVTNIQNGANGGIVDAYLTLGEDVAPLDGDMVKATETRVRPLLEKQGKLVSKRFGTTNIEDIKNKVSALTAMLAPLRESGELSDFVRDLMKPPFMTFGYASGFDSMSNSMAAGLIDDVMQKVMNSKRDDIGAQNMAWALGIDYNTLKKAVKTDTYNTIKTNNGKTVLEAFRGLIRGVYGDAVESTMKKEFDGVRTINASIIDATNTMYSIFKVAYDKEVKELGIEGVPSMEQHNKIIAKLHKVGLTPIIKGPASKSYDDGIALYGVQSEVAADNKYGNPMIHRPKENQSLRPKRLGYKAPGAKAVVLETQYTDGSGTANVTLNHENLQVFDAHVVGVNQANIIDDINEDFAKTNTRTDWSQTGTVVEALDRMIKAAEKAYGDINPAVQELKVEEEVNRLALDAEGRHKAMDEYVPLNGILAGIKEIDTATQLRRKSLQKYTYTVEQFVLDKEHAYEHKGNGTKNSTKTTKPRVVTSTMVKDLLSADLESLSDISVPEDNTDIITPDNTEVDNSMQGTQPKSEYNCD